MFQCSSRILLTFWSLISGIDDSSIDLVRYVAYNSIGLIQLLAYISMPRLPAGTTMS